MDRDTEIESRYSDPLPCRKCKNTLDPVGEFRRDEAAFCKKYDSAKNRKPYGVLFGNRPCEFFDGEN